VKLDQNSAIRILKEFSKLEAVNHQFPPSSDGGFILPELQIINSLQLQL
jgi:hypothetical protein